MQIKRLLAAAILLPPFYFYVMKLPGSYFFALLLSIALLAMWEFYSMYRVDALMKGAGMVCGGCIFFAAYLTGDPLPYVSLPAFMTIFAIRLFGRREPGSSLRDISYTILALLYIPCLLSFQLLIRQLGGPRWIIFLFGCVWIADSFALYVGKGMGRRKLYAEVSPNKTVAGAVGSVVGGAFSGWLLNLVLVRALDPWKAALMGLIIGTTTIIGDLVESMFKRDAGVKDSSTIIPGHGGVLDKVDGVLFAGPILYWVSVAAGLME